jgi:hypothetical protein
MNAKEVLSSALRSTQNMLSWYLSDLSDADLLVRPVPAANHIAWQLGHLIQSEAGIAGQIDGARYPELPAGFAEQYTKATASEDSPRKFLTKAEYLDLFNRTRSATLALVDRLSENDLSKPTAGNMAKFAPTFADLLLLISSHTLMHAGQFTVVRRKLGKPVLF